VERGEEGVWSVRFPRKTDWVMGERQIKKI